jgi:hypothetical protein
MIEECDNGMILQASRIKNEFQMFEMENNDWLKMMLRVFDPLSFVGFFVNMHKNPIKNRQ